MNVLRLNQVMLKDLKDQCVHLTHILEMLFVYWTQQRFYILQVVTFF